MMGKILGLTLVCLMVGSMLGGLPSVVQADVEPIARIDNELLYLIDHYAEIRDENGNYKYYNQDWNLSLEDYKAWIATITWAEAGTGGYAAHSEYGSRTDNLKGDRFGHVYVDTDAGHEPRFSFSTGIGAFQMDELSFDGVNWAKEPTIRKINPKLALLSVLEWHKSTRAKDSTLEDFSKASPWLAVRPDKVAIRWRQVTGTDWALHKDARVNEGDPGWFYWREIEIQIGLDDPFRSSVEYKGQVKWDLEFTTDAGKNVHFNRYYNTWLITPRGWGGSVATEGGYYYAYDKSQGCEVWVWNNAGEENEFRYIFTRDYTTGKYPEGRTHEGAYWIGDRYIALAGTTADMAALNPDDLKCSEISKGLNWLREKQNPDGSWTYSGRITEENVGLTSIAVLSFLNWGLDETDFDVLQAINWILEQQNPDGSITTGTYHVYDTSLATLALVATRNDSYYDEIKSATSFLIDLQNNESEGYSESDKCYGGWPYWEGMTNWADLSNSQFVLLALHFAEQFDPSDTIVPADVWSKAEIFVRRCQNREASNPDYNFYDDGGFIYMPSSTIWAGGQSYASITTAGLWGLYTCGVSESDGRVQDAWGWVENNYYVDRNYPIGNLFLYYYHYSLAKACILWDVEEINGHDWYDEMSDVLVNNQQADGHWPETNPSEEPDNVATCWALLALISKQIPPGAGLSFEVDSPADLHVYNPKGRHVGIDYETGLVEIEIPGATYSGPGTEPQVIYIPNPIAGTYNIELIGTASGEYTYTVRGLIDGTVISEESYTGSITLGEVQESTSIVSAIAGAITVETTEPNAPPVADANGPYTGLIGEPITFDGTGSYDPDGTSVSYEWDLDDDGEFDDAFVATPSKTWDAPYSGNISLRVTDDDGATDIDSTTLTVEEVIPATIDFDPDTLNNKSEGKWITVYTELPAGYNVTDINASTMMLNETFPAELQPTEVEDYDSDGISDLMVKFDRQAVIDILPIGDAVNVTVTGKLYDGTPFEGSDTIRVIA